MKKSFCVLLFVYSFGFAQNTPTTKSIPNLISKFGISYSDDYSWLENAKSEETRNWVLSQNEFTASHLDIVRKDFNILNKIKEYNQLSSNGLPTKKEGYYYSNYIKDNEKPSVLFYRKDLDAEPIEIFNPNKIYKNSVASISAYSPSKNSKYLACNVTLDGSDRTEIRFVNIPKSSILEDLISNVKFSRTVWNKDLGVFYKRNSNQNKMAQDSTFQLHYHKIGTNQTEDKLIFDTSDTKNDFSYSVKGDRLFIVETSRINRKRDFYYCVLNDESFEFVKFIDGDDSTIDLISINKNKVYFTSNEYDWGDVRSFDVSDRSKEEVIIPQIYNNLLVDTFSVEDFIFCKYKTIGKNYIIVYNKDGVFKRKFDSPEGTDFIFKFYEPKTKELFISVFSKTISYQNFKLNIETGDVKHFYNDYIRPKVTLFPLDYFVTKSITYKSRDNKDVPITIIHKKGLVLDGTNPTLLKAYGGFGVVSGLNYEPSLLYFLEKGGVYAFAEIRGGGEKGLKWHKDGMGLKKQNSFNDFIDAAEFLISEKYTSPKKLAITGSSNGGLVVGVALIQRPDLFKIAIPEVGVFDMINYTKFTVGDFLKKEYGNPEKQLDFESLFKFSPYHNIKNDVNYPTTLIVTSENDDRAVPMHSYKFAAKLQNRTAQKNPIYLKTLSDAGHSGKSNYNNYFEEEAAFYGFILYHLRD